MFELFVHALASALGGVFGGGANEKARKRAEAWRGALEGAEPTAFSTISQARPKVVFGNRILVLALCVAAVVAMQIASTQIEVTRSTGSVKFAIVILIPFELILALMLLAHRWLELTESSITLRSLMRTSFSLRTAEIDRVRFHIRKRHRNGVNEPALVVTFLSAAKAWSLENASEPASLAIARVLPERARREIASDFEE